MGAAFFYHLTDNPLEATLPVLLEKAMEKRWRVVVRATDDRRLEWLDRALWQGDGFLPHGIAGGTHDARQPVLLTRDTDAPNGAKCLMSMDGAPVSQSDLEKMERVCVLFDGADKAAVETAREQWRSLTAAGGEAQYWAEEDGRWVKKAESG